MEIPDNRTAPQRAIDEIDEILKKYDLAAMVIVMDQSNVAMTRCIDPTWSCAWMEEQEGGDGAFMVRIRSKLSDYGGDKARQKAEIEATTGMFITFMNWCGDTRETMVKITAMLAKHFPEMLHSEKWTGGKTGGKWNG